MTNSFASPFTGMTQPACTLRESLRKGLGDSVLQLRRSHPCIYAISIEFLAADGTNSSLGERRLTLRRFATRCRLVPGRWLLSRIPWSEAEHQIPALNAHNLIAQHLQIARNKACLCIERRTWPMRAELHTLVSMDSTIRSNLAVGLPVDLVIVKRDRYAVARHMSIDSDDEYFHDLRDLWSEALREAFARLPEPGWLGQPLP